MPVEIRELTIKVNVNQQQGSQAAAGSAVAATSSIDESKTALVKQAVEETLRIIESKKER